MDRHIGNIVTNEVFKPANAFTDFVDSDHYKNLIQIPQLGLQFRFSTGHGSETLYAAMPSACIGRDVRDKI